MLAKAGTLETINNDGYILEEKLDGIRCMVYVEDGKIRLCSRMGKPLDTAFPDVIEYLYRLISLGPAVYDGEIIPRNKDYTFQNLQTRLQRITDVEHAINMCPVEFVMFDVLIAPGYKSLLDEPLHERRALMSELANNLNIKYSAQITTEQALNILADPSKEGVMAKIYDSDYRPGQRSGMWLKIKSMRSLEAIIGGCTFGVGRRALEAGSFLLGEETIDGLKYIGNVGTGFTNEMLADICKLIDVFQTDESPFLGWPSSELESGLVKSFCKPGKLRAVVNFQERTREGMLRFPSLKSYKVDSEA
jgi:bifunctional non-homologous end joining protein LigD